MSIEWLNPSVFYFVLPTLAVWVCLALYARARRAHAAAAFATKALHERLFPKVSTLRFWLKTSFFALALTFALLALARPCIGTYIEEVRPHGSDIYVLIDVSRSMLAEDVAPSRLGRAKSDVSLLLNSLQGERIGLIAFAGKAAVKVPLTTDYGYFRIGLNELDPNSAPRGGTAIGDAIRKALQVMPPENERDRTILLITDGDDMESYPLQAADLAAEQHVAIYVVGLGDPNEGARVPDKKNAGSAAGGATSFMSHNGEQVWSKLNDPLLREIALKTEGVYVPARTSSYDLGELYKNELAKRRSVQSQGGGDLKRERHAERFQWFLGTALFFWLLELLVALYPKNERNFASVKTVAASKNQAPVTGLLLLMGTILSLNFSASLSAAETEAEAASVPQKGNSRELVREGLELYQKGELDPASEKLKASDEATLKEEGPANSIVAFDLGCVYHRKGDTEKAREQYLKAALSKDFKLAVSALYNLGNLSAEKGRTLAGEKPEETPSEKRQEILDSLKEAVVQYRACLDIQSTHAESRKNIELIRQWIKIYSAKWRQYDRNKLRQEMNLLQFLQYLIESEQTLRNSELQLGEHAPADTFAEFKRAQEELLEEIEPLKEKINTALEQAQNPPAPQGQGAGQGTQKGLITKMPSGTSTPNVTAIDPKKAEQMKQALTGFADAAASHMLTASAALGERKAEKAAAAQKLSIDEFEKIWTLAAPFQVLLQRALRDQTQLVSTLDPEGTLKQPESLLDQGVQWFKDTFDLKGIGKKTEPNLKDKSDPKNSPAKTEAPKWSDRELSELTDLQESNLRRTTMMRLKAKFELEELQKQPPEATPSTPPPAAGSTPPAEPAQPSQADVKKGLEKAVELAPKAEDAMKQAIERLRQKDTVAALPDAETARKILDEIMKAQPKDKEQEKKDQDKKDQDQKNKDEQKKKDDEKKKQDQQDKDKDKQDQQKKDDEKKKQDPAKAGDDKKQELSKDQAEALLRQIREREQDRRKKQKEKEDIGLIQGTSVDKDW